MSQADLEKPEDMPWSSLLQPEALSQTWSPCAVAHNHGNRRQSMRNVNWTYYADSHYNNKQQVEPKADNKLKVIPKFYPVSSTTTAAAAVVYQFVAAAWEYHLECMHAHSIMVSNYNISACVPAACIPHNAEESPE